MPGAYDKSYSWAYNTGCAWYPHCKPCSLVGLYVCGSENIGRNMEKFLDNESIWEFDSGRTTQDSMTVDGEGFIESKSGNWLFLFDPTPTEIWSLRSVDYDPPGSTGFSFLDSCIGPNRNVHVASQLIEQSSGNSMFLITLIDESGDLTYGQWYEFGTETGAIRTTIDVDNSGGASVISSFGGNKVLAKFDQGGNKIWDFGALPEWEGTGGCRIDPATGDTIIFLGLSLHRISSSGSEVTPGSWPVTVPAGSTSIEAIAMDGNGTTYVSVVSAGGGSIVAYSPDGTIVWQTDNFAIFYSIAVMEGSYVYAHDGTLIYQFLNGVMMTSFTWSDTGDVAVDPGRAGAFR